MTAQSEHWERVYKTKASDAVSWYRPHLETSLRLIADAAPDKAAAIIDIGGGESTLPDDLTASGYRNLTVLDLSATAIEATRARLGAAASGIRWIVGDVVDAPLPASAYDVWHDRAAFHFLVTAEQREAYLRQLSHALKPGAYVVLATFGPQGPEKCSGLPVARYDAESLQQILGTDYVLRESLVELHRTPSGSSQQFQYGLFKRKS